MQWGMAIEFEPEYEDEFKTYLRAKEAISLALYTIDMARAGTIPEDIRKRAAKVLRNSRKEIGSLQDRLQPETYMSSLLSKALPPGGVQRMPENIDIVLAILDSKKTITEDQHKELTTFFSQTFSSLTQVCQPLEEKVLGGIRSSATYYP